MFCLFYQILLCLDMMHINLMQHQINNAIPESRRDGKFLKYVDKMLVHREILSLIKCEILNLLLSKIPH